VGLGEGSLKEVVTDQPDSWRGRKVLVTGHTGWDRRVTEAQIDRYPELEPLS